MLSDEKTTFRSGFDTSIIVVGVDHVESLVGVGVDSFESEECSDSSLALLPFSSRLRQPEREKDVLVKMDVEDVVREEGGLKDLLHPILLNLVHQE